jgi:hypothetical protein
LLVLLFGAVALLARPATACAIGLPAPPHRPQQGASGTVAEPRPRPGWLSSQPGRQGTNAQREAAEGSSLCQGVSPTPYFTVLHGTVSIRDAPLPPGTVVRIYTPRDEVAGCSVVRYPGHYGYVHVYGQDRGDPTVPGFREGEKLAFKVNGVPATPDVELAWTFDREPHKVDLTVPSYGIYLPLLRQSR